MHLARIALLSGSLFLVGHPLQAQRPGGRTGFWAGAGLGSGWARVSCVICDSGRDVGVSVSARLGGRLRRRLLLGVEGTGWWGGEGDVNERLWTIGPVVTWYPNPRRGLHYTGGLTLAFYRADDGTDELTASGAGPQLGVGYDFSIGRAWSLTPFGNVIVASLGTDLKLNGTTVVDDVSLTLLQLGVSLTRH